MPLGAVRKLSTHAHKGNIAQSPYNHYQVLEFLFSTNLCILSIMSYINALHNSTNNFHLTFS